MRWKYIKNEKGKVRGRENSERKMWLKLKNGTLNERYREKKYLGIQEDSAKKKRKKEKKKREAKKHEKDNDKKTIDPNFYQYIK